MDCSPPDEYPDVRHPIPCLFQNHARKTLLPKKWPNLAHHHVAKTSILESSSCLWPQNEVNDTKNTLCHITHITGNTNSTQHSHLFSKNNKQLPSLFRRPYVAETTTHFRKKSLTFKKFIKKYKLVAQKSVPCHY